MKYLSIPILTACALAVVAVSAIEPTSSEPSDSPPGLDDNNPPADAAREQRKNEQAKQRMRRRSQLIASRIGMASSFDATETTDPATGVDSIQELYDSGFIIPATLEEVEAALQAAASTPETEGDRAALILKHRGSYRFFIND